MFSAYSSATSLQPLHVASERSGARRVREPSEISVGFFLAQVLERQYSDRFFRRLSARSRTRVTPKKEEPPPKRKALKINERFRRYV